MLCEKLKRFIVDPTIRFEYLTRMGVFKRVSDEKYLKRKFKLIFGRELNLEKPVLFNEKLQWLKLHDRRPEYTMMVDKYEVKEYVASIIGDEYVIPTLGVWERFEDIDFDSLPNQFVLKCTHDSGSVVICKDKSVFDFTKAESVLKRSLKNNYFWSGREWPYKNIKPRIIAEKFLTDNGDCGGTELTDYKFFCFNGVADSVMVCTERNTGSPKFYFFDKNWELRRYNVRGKDAPVGFTLPKPDKMDSMFEIAEKLSNGIPHVRVDLYKSGERIYFGEMTFYSESGFDKNLLPETDLLWGEKIETTETHR